MSQRAENLENVKLTILEAMVKGYQECFFAVGVGEKFEKGEIGVGLYR